MGIKGSRGGLSYFKPLKGKTLPEVLVKKVDPTATESSHDPGDIWVNTVLNNVFIMADKTGGIGTWVQVSSGEPQQIDNDFISGILEVLAFGAAVATEGNRYIASATGSGWTQHYIYTYQNAAWVEIIPTAGAMGYNENTSAFVYYTGSLWSALPSGVTTLAGLSDTAIAAVASAQILIYDGSNSWDNKTVSGHATISTAGVISVTGIANLAILDDGGANDAILSFTTQTSSAPTLTVPDFAGVNDSFAFITLAQTLVNKTLTTPKIVTTGSITDAGGAAYLTFVEGSTPTDSIQITTGNTGVGAKIESITSDTNADLIFDAAGSGDIKVLDGTEMYFARSTNDLLFTFTDQASQESTVIFPSMSNASDTACLIAETQTLTNKTLTAVKIVTTGFIADGGGDEFLKFLEVGTPVTYLEIANAATGAAPSLRAKGETNVHLLLGGVGTGNVQFGDGADVTKLVEFEIVGATTGKTMTITSSHSDNRTLTLPNATDTLVGKATTDVLTNKSLDADGTGNVITNINMNEMDADTIPASSGNNVTIVDGLIMAKVSNNATNFTIYNANAPYAFMVIDAWSINISADGGTWKLNDGNAGGGTDITDVVTVAAADKGIDRITTIDDATAPIASSGSLSIVFDGAGTLDAYIFIRIVRLA